MFIHIDPYRHTEVVFAAGYPRDYRTIAPLAIRLHTHAYDGLSSPKGYAVRDGVLYVDKGVWWDGSTVVLDTRECLLSSLIHDLLCDLIDNAPWSRWKKWRYRRIADTIYADVNKEQGMSAIRAEVRWLGLRLFGPVYTMINKLKSKR